MTGRRPIFLPPDGGLALDLGGSCPHILMSGADSEGQTAIVRTLQSPGGGPPLHLHTREDEAFFVLDGSFTFTCGDSVVEGQAGSFAMLPRGIPHRYEAGVAGGVLLMIFSPAGMEDYFRQWERLLVAERWSHTAMATLAAEHGITLLESYRNPGPPQDR